MDINQIHVNSDSEVLCRIQGLNEMVRYEFWVFFFGGKEMVPFERYEKRDDLSLGFVFGGRKDMRREFFILFIVFFFRRNYILLICGLPEKHFFYLWLKIYVFPLEVSSVYLKLSTSVKTWVNLYFCYPFTSFSSQNIKNYKIKRKEDLKDRFCKN